MKVQLKSLETLETSSAGSAQSEYETLFCGICRTDAKMYFEGQRDLVLPRVLGHELVVQHRETGRRYVPWPATSCGHCSFCLSGRENLCEDIRIMGFHFDGGYQQFPTLQGVELFEVSRDLPAQLYTFCEPVGCVLHAFKPICFKPGERMIIFGAGTLGLIAAFLAKQMGLDVLLIEKNMAKIEHVQGICDNWGLQITRQSDSGDFDYALNACADYIAFSQGIGKLKKGGRCIFFSGITKNEQLPTNLINLLHYKELVIEGAYGLCKADLQKAIGKIEQHSDFFTALICQIIPPQMVENALRELMTGFPLKSILDFSKDHRQEGLKTENPHPLTHTQKAYIWPEIPPILSEITSQAQFSMDDKAKPLGALGKLEQIAVRLCSTRNTLQPSLKNKAMFIFAGDHGITEEGVSAYPQEVTAQMVQNFLEGKSAINVLCRQFGIDLKIVDMGVKIPESATKDFAESTHSESIFRKGDMLISKSVRPGTRNFALTQAMTEDEALLALQYGMDVIKESHQQKPLDIVGLGEMGIGNTSSASLIISSITGRSLEALCGRGTGVDDVGLAHKLKVLKKIHAFHQLNQGDLDGLKLLAKVGGFEIAGIAGAALQAASMRIPIVLDGVISTAAGLLAHALNPKVADYFIIGHKSVEPGHLAACQHLGLEPVQDLGMRLGEGTGAALTISLAETAARLIEEMATFEEARISRHKPIVGHKTDKGPI